MKKIIFFILIAGLVSFYGCKNNSCSGIVTYPKLDPSLLNYFYKPGSYWVYRDSAGGNTDSQYVYSYQYRVHYRNPDDTPYPYYQVTATGITSTTYCGPYYLDDITMHIQNFVNGVLKDTFTFHSLGGDEEVAIYEHNTPSILLSSATAFIIDWTKIGFLDCCDYISQGGDTTGSWYLGIQPSISSGSYNFQNVYLWTIQIDDGSSPWFAHPADLYITSGSGIIKMVQHLPTGDVKWDLINYHIAP